jgi:amidase
MTQSTIRQYGGADVNRSLDLFLASMPELDLPAYMRALAQRAKHVRHWMLFLERYPIVVGPVSTEPPFVVGFDTADVATSQRVFTAQRLLVGVNLLGLPAVSVPSGSVDGVPLGVQVIAGRYREDLALDAAEAIEAQCGLATPVDV